MVAKNHANKGRSLELVVKIGQAGVVTLAHIPPGVRWIGPKQTVPIPSPVDFMGTVNETPTRPARPICFDAKRAATKTRFDVGHKDHVPEHQRQFIIQQGKAGAIAGLLVEATHLYEYRWLDWRHMTSAAKSLRWDDPCWVKLGPASHTIDFRRIPGVLEVLS